VIEQLERSRQNDLSRLIYGLGIRHVGEKAAATLARHFRSMERLMTEPTEALQSVSEIGPVVAAQGWAANGVPVTAHQAGLAVHRALYHWRLFGLLDEVRAKWEGGRPTGPNVTALNAVGRSTSIALLRARATAPRTDLRG